MTPEDAPPAEERPRAHRPWLRGLVGLLLGIALVVFGVPAVGDLGAVGDELARLAGWQIGVLSVLALLAVGAAASMWMAAAPGLRPVPVLLLFLSCTATGYILPAGGAVATAMTLGMLSLLGVPSSRVPAVVLVAGLWNVLVRMGLPVVAFLAAELTGEPPAPLRASAGVGAAVVVSIVAGLVLLETVGGRGRVAGRVGAVLARLVGRLGRRGGDPAAFATEFRAALDDIVRRRWPAMTAAAVAFPLVQFAVLWTTLVFLGAEPEPVGVFGAFAIVSQVTSVPVTPGALGVAELSLIGALRSAGVGASLATTATVVYRFYTYVLLIPLGGLAYLLWNRRVFVPRR